MILISGKVMGPLIGLVMEVVMELMESLVMDLVLGKLMGLLAGPIEARMAKMGRKGTTAAKIRETMPMIRKRGGCVQVHWSLKVQEVKPLHIANIQTKVILPYTKHTEKNILV